MDIKNYIKVSDSIHTSGQPKPNEFEYISLLAVKTVINLAMPDSDGALPDEGSIVSANGMNYIHIPVVWTDPKEEQFRLFATIMNQHSDSIVWVHCALNWRVSTFIYLYKLKHLGQSNDDAYTELLKVWIPNDDWQSFINKIA